MAPECQHLLMVGYAYVIHEPNGIKVVEVWEDGVRYRRFSFPDWERESSKYYGESVIWGHNILGDIIDIVKMKGMPKDYYNYLKNEEEERQL